MTLRANSTAEKKWIKKYILLLEYTKYYQFISHTSVTHKIYYVKIFLNIFLLLPLRLLTLRRILCN